MHVMKIIAKLFTLAKKSSERVKVKQALVPTRRGLLSRLCGLYDPLCLCARIAVSGINRMKELVVRGTEWDDERGWWEPWNGLLESASMSFVFTGKQSQSSDDLLGPNGQCKNFVQAIQCAQAESFEKGFEALAQCSTVPRSSRLKDLTPFIDDKGLIRAGG
eukprot:TCALIF_07706-PA protein Name:"Protein of unknown function" AED:0.42 eAED:0.42 QI:0/0/0/0.5/0/0.25/4/0/161